MGSIASPRVGAASPVKPSDGSAAQSPRDHARSDYDSTSDPASLGVSAPGTPGMRRSAHVVAGLRRRIGEPAFERAVAALRRLEEVAEPENDGPETAQDPSPSSSPGHSQTPPQRAPVDKAAAAADVEAAAAAAAEAAAEADAALAGLRASEVTALVRLVQMTED